MGCVASLPFSFHSRSLPSHNGKKWSGEKFPRPDFPAAALGRATVELFSSNYPASAREAGSKLEQL
jgi:hypothetical protein